MTDEPEDDLGAAKGIAIAAFVSVVGWVLLVLAILAYRYYQRRHGHG